MSDLQKEMLAELGAYHVGSGEHEINDPVEFVDYFIAKVREHHTYELMDQHAKDLQGVHDRTKQETIAACLEALDQPFDDCDLTITKWVAKEIARNAIMGLEKGDE